VEADVAILMEFSEKKHEVIEAVRSAYRYTAGCVRGRHCHFAVLSKVPIVHAEVREGWKGPLMVRVTLGGAFAGVHVLGVHFPRLPHVTSQFEQMTVLLTYLGKLKGPMVVAGDFNATLFSNLITDFENESRLVRLTGLPTWPAYFQLPQFGIDHVFVSPRIRMVERPRLGRSSGSDHYPVVTAVALPSR
jgi:endonuclease/exonuclease/phosphatase (EEP) superfamily protein YafD